MAETSDFDRKHNDELSASTYAGKKIYETIVSFLGIGLGAAVGYSMDKHHGFQATAKKKFGWRTIAGAVVGSTISGIILGYQHWRKVESTKIAVQEINNDISNMTIRQRTDPELIRENDRLREMLDQMDAQPPTPPAKSTAHKDSNAPSAMVKVDDVEKTAAPDEPHTQLG